MGGCLGKDPRTISYNHLPRVTARPWQEEPSVERSRSDDFRSVSGGSSRDRGESWTERTRQRTSDEEDSPLRQHNSATETTSTPRSFTYYAPQRSQSLSAPSSNTPRSARGSAAASPRVSKLEGRSPAGSPRASGAGKQLSPAAEALSEKSDRSPLPETGLRAGPQRASKRPQDQPSSPFSSSGGRTHPTSCRCQGCAPNLYRQDGRFLNDKFSDPCSPGCLCLRCQHQERPSKLSTEKRAKAPPQGVLHTKKCRCHGCVPYAYETDGKPIKEWYYECSAGCRCPACQNQKQKSGTGASSRGGPSQKSGGPGSASSRSGGPSARGGPRKPREGGGGPSSQVGGSDTTLAIWAKGNEVSSKNPLGRPRYDPDPDDSSSSERQHVKKCRCPACRRAYYGLDGVTPNKSMWLLSPCVQGCLCPYCITEASARPRVRSPRCLHRGHKLPARLQCKYRFCPCKIGCAKEGCPACDSRVADDKVRQWLASIPAER